MVFGGTVYTSRSLLLLSEEGELEQDASDSRLIPEMMSEGSFRVVRGKLYAAGGMERSLRAFDGKNWSQL